MSLIDRFTALRETQPHVRARDAAQQLGVSEGELVAADPNAQRLRPEWGELLRRVTTLGRVMALTRNETAVHERRGTYEDVQVSTSPMGLVLGPDIDLRLFLNSWYAVFALNDGEKRSLQVFDNNGVAVHKIHLIPESNVEAFDAIVAEFATDLPFNVEPVAPVAAAPAEVAPDVAEAFGTAWSNMQDTHDFFGLLRKFGLTRTQALEIAGPTRANRVPIEALDRTLTLAATQQTPIMVFVGNRGCLQIHSGPIANVRPARGWINILDPQFNLHVRGDRLASAWVVRKPTRDGIVTSLEVFDVDGDLAVQLFGVRKPGIPEDPRWAAIAAVEG